MSWTDEEIDNFAREAAEGSSFEYKDDYWKEMDGMLPLVSKKKDILWVFTSFIFVGLIGVSFFKQPLTDREISATVLDGTAKKLYNQTDRSNAKNNEYLSTGENLLEDDLPLKASANSTQVQSKVNTSFTKQVVPTEKLALADSNMESNSALIEDNHNQLASLAGKSFNETGSLVVEEVDESSFELNQSGSIDRLPLLSISAHEWEKGLMASTFFAERTFPMKATIYVGGFGGLSQSLVTPSSSLSNSFGIGVGTQIQKGKLLITAGLNGVWSNHQDLILNRRAKVYSFGSSEYNYDFDYNEIYSLEAELSVGYKLGKHTINIGARPSYVMGTKVGITSSVNDALGERSTYYGNMDGINRFGVKPFLGYAIDLAPSLKLGLNVGVQLMPMVQEGYLIGSNSKLPIDGQLYLRKSLRFKR